MKAITIHQPYASLIMAGVKRYETRSRNTRIRGRIAIHAGSKDPYQVLKELPDDVREKIIGIQKASGINQLPMGAIIGTVELVNVVPVENLWGKTTPEEIYLGDFTRGRYAYVLREPDIFDEPIPAKGAQGWWTWGVDYKQEKMKKRLGAYGQGEDIRPITLDEISNVKLYNAKGLSIDQLAEIFKRSQYLIADIIDGKYDCIIIDDFVGAGRKQ